MIALVELTFEEDPYEGYSPQIVGFDELSGTNTHGILFPQCTGRPGHITGVKVGYKLINTHFYVSGGVSVCLDSGVLKIDTKPHLVKKFIEACLK